MYVYLLYMSITPSYFEESVKNSLENCNTNVNLNKSILSDGISTVCIYISAKLL